MKDLFQIWESIKEGDEDAFEFLCNETSHQLYAYAYGIIRDYQLAEEIVNDIFINLWNRRKEIIIR